MLKSYEFKFNWTSCTFVKSAHPTQSFLTPPWVLITVAGRTLQRPPAGSLPSTLFRQMVNRYPNPSWHSTCPAHIDI